MAERIKLGPEKGYSVLLGAKCHEDGCDSVLQTSYKPSALDGEEYKVFCLGYGHSFDFSSDSIPIKNVDPKMLNGLDCPRCVEDTLQLYTDLGAVEEHKENRLVCLGCEYEPDRENDVVVFELKR